MRVVIVILANFTGIKLVAQVLNHFLFLRYLGYASMHACHCCKGIEIFIWIATSKSRQVQIWLYVIFFSFFFWKISLAAAASRNLTICRHIYSPNKHERELSCHVLYKQFQVLNNTNDIFCIFMKIINKKCNYFLLLSIWPWLQLNQVTLS